MNKTATEYVLRPEDPAQRREREWAEGMATMAGYLFDLRVGGGPDLFTAWTVKRDDGVDVPFLQADGESPQAAVLALVGRLNAYVLVGRVIAPLTQDVLDERASAIRERLVQSQEIVPLIAADAHTATADESSTDNERGSASTKGEALSVQPTEKRP